MTIDKKSSIIYVIAIIIVAINLRAGITCVGPILSLINEDLHLSYTQMGFLTTLPLIAFATVSILVTQLYRKLGLEKVIILGIILIALGTYGRTLSGWTLLLICTFAMGSGIAICNVALIPFIKKHFKNNYAEVTGAYTLFMSVFAALGSGFSAPLALEYGMGWRGSMAFWSYFTIIAIVFWIYIWTRGISKRPEAMPTDYSIWKSNKAWHITIFMGLQSLLFYSFAAWGPEILQTKGFSISESGWAIFYLQIISLPAVFLVPVWAKNKKYLPTIVWAMSFGYLIAFTSMFFNEKYIIYFGLTIMGWAMGGSISFAYFLINTKTKKPETTIRLSAMTQSFGYLLAAVGPFIVGWVFDLVQNWNFIIVGFLVFSIAYFYFSVRSSQLEAI
ncbi:MFS transporter [Membranihabitans marinus]|uniref:MFS transporter n=1 Tax=Membranihabitans marinus TaxID=1227546 RepID=UPI001EFF7EE5|nr:MFS transporter [Membranihabitans marinus]